MAKAGNEGKATDEDDNTLDLTGSTGSGVHATVATTTDSDGNGFDGTVTWANSAGVVLGTLDFENIENNIVPFFTPGTLIGTPKGQRKIEDLVVGDRVITRSDGIQ